MLKLYFKNERQKYQLSPYSQYRIVKSNKHFQRQTDKMAQPQGFTQAQLTAFFTNAPQMALSVAQRDRLAQEGLILVEDFVDFKDDQLDQAAKNMRTSIPGFPTTQPDANGVVLVAAVPAVNLVLISARCMLRLKVASIAYHCYESIERAITPSNMNYTCVLCGFYQEC